MSIFKTMCLEIGQVFNEASRKRVVKVKPRFGFFRRTARILGLWCTSLYTDGRGFLNLCKKSG
jgi:hypothetical protein